MISVRNIIGKEGVKGYMGNRGTFSGITGERVYGHI